MLKQTNELALRRRAAKVVPGGMYGHQATTLLPESFPQYFSRAEGAYIWDTDGNKYLDLMCAYGPNILGYNDARVARAVHAQLALGDTMTGPSALMVDLAELMVEMVSHADWAMFCKNGTDATTIAMTLARAQTGKRKVLVAEGAYHGAAPWCTPILTGTVAEDRANLIRYRYNDVDSLEAAVRVAGDDLAAIFATPFRHEAFEDQYLASEAYARRAREICDQSGAMLIVDDVRAGFRLVRDCSWELHSVRPDVSTWGKLLANGQALSAVVGSDSCREGAKSIYVTGSFWFSAVPMAAAIQTLKTIRNSDYLERTVALGERLRAGLDAAAEAHGFRLRQTGPAQMPQILFSDDPDFRIGYGFVAGMLERGVYMHPWHNMFLCAAMTQEDIDFAINAGEATFKELQARRHTLQPNPRLLALFQMHGLVL
jgi:glutamate-1-semialdehyde 2,1-aminomutase